MCFWEGRNGTPGGGEVCSDPEVLSELAACENVRLWLSTDDETGYPPHPPEGVPVGPAHPGEMDTEGTFVPEAGSPGRTLVSWYEPATPPAVELVAVVDE
jgi:hypothetical protein